jgi:hypothetical protein
MATSDAWPTTTTLNAIPKDAVCACFAARQYSSRLAAEQRRTDQSFQGWFVRSYTDFPMTSITLYACWNQENWVIMLPSEY